MEQQYGVWQDPAQQARLERIGRSLVAQSERKDQPFQFKILNSPDVNALACPGGYIYVFRGLLDYMPDDAELAGVLGHEIGHVVKRHTVRQMEKNMWTQLAAVLAGVATGSGDVMMAGMVVTDALAAGYSRADESQADRCGFDYALKAGYSPYGILITMHKLQQLAAEYGNPGWGLFDSHPDPEERIRGMNKLLAKLSVTPQPVPRDDGTADVVETAGGKRWRFTFRESAGNNTPAYRADLLAGALYQVKRRARGFGKVYRPGPGRPGGPLLRGPGAPDGVPAGRGDPDAGCLCPRCGRFPARLGDPGQWHGTGKVRERRDAGFCKQGG